MIYYSSLNKTKWKNAMLNKFIKEEDSRTSFNIKYNKSIFKINVLSVHFSLAKFQKFCIKASQLICIARNFNLNQIRFVTQSNAIPSVLIRKPIGI